MKTKNIILLLILFTISSSTLKAQYSYWDLTYNTAIPVSKTKEFINPMSFRGMGFEGRWFLDENLTLGGSLGWNTFYEKLRKTTALVDNGALTASQFRTINAFPMTMNLAWFGGSRATVARPMIGMGVGTTHQIRKVNISIIEISEKTWHFSLQPEVGVVFPTGGGANLFLSVKYNYSFKTKDVPDLSYIGINIGFLWEN